MEQCQWCNGVYIEEQEGWTAELYQDNVDNGGDVNNENIDIIQEPDMHNVDIVLLRSEIVG